MSIIISCVRVYYDKSETSFIRIFLESFICGCLTVSVGSGMVVLGYGPNSYLFCGGVIGFMGTQSVRALANKLINK